MQRVTKPFVERREVAIEEAALVRFAVEIRKVRQARSRKLLLYQFEIPEGFDFANSWRGRSSPGLHGNTRRFRFD